VRSLLVVLALLLAQRAAHAQIVNVQSVLAKQPPTDGAIGQLELKLDWREGNNRLLDLGAAASLIVKHERWLGLAIARGEYGHGREDTFKQRTFEHLRMRATLDCRWKWEAFAQHELDRFRRLTVRALAGAGPALQLVSSEPASALLGAAYMLEYERLDEREGASDAGHRSVSHRASLYVTGTEKAGENVAITQTFYVQPRIAEPRDVRLLGELSITSKLSKHVALTDAFIITFDSRPPDGIRRYDTQLRIALLLTL
jgi:hypothetical protein